jgi:hypothetical protein
LGGSCGRMVCGSCIRKSRSFAALRMTTHLLPKLPAKTAR